MKPFQGAIKSYSHALSILKNRDSRLIQNHTKLNKTYDDGIGVQTYDGGIGVRLWGTNVVTFYPDNTIELSSGGYRTNTTKERINHYCPHGSVGSHPLYPDWVYYHSREEWFKSEVEFHDGMRLDPHGTAHTRPVILSVLETRLGVKLPSLDEVGDLIGGMGLKDIKKLARNRYLRPTALEYCNKEFLPMFLGDESVAGIIERRLR